MSLCHYYTAKPGKNKQTRKLSVITKPQVGLTEYICHTLTQFNKCGNNLCKMQKLKNTAVDLVLFLRCLQNKKQKKPKIFLQFRVCIVSPSAYMY